MGLGQALRGIRRPRRPHEPGGQRGGHPQDEAGPRPSGPANDPQGHTPPPHNAGRRNQRGGAGPHRGRRGQGGAVESRREHREPGRHTHRGGRGQEGRPPGFVGPVE